MSTDDMLNESFRNVGREYGYDEVSAEFVAFKELKIRWQRSKGRADFKLSDYLADADARVLEDIARTLFLKITGNETSYPESMNEWVTSDRFLRMKQPVYIRRSKNLSRSPKGKYRDLDESCERLERAGLIKKDDGVFISWTKDPNVRRVGYCSVLMKVVAISSVFDKETVPEFVLDYVVYHEYIHIMLGFDPFSKKHGPQFKTEEKKYPRLDEAEQWLKKLRLYL